MSYSLFVQAQICKAADGIANIWISNYFFGDTHTHTKILPLPSSCGGFSLHLHTACKPESVFAVCLFMFSLQSPPRKCIIVTMVVWWCFRLKAVWGGLKNGTCDRDDSIICQLPARRQRAASLLLRWVPVYVWLECPKLPKGTKLFCLFSKQNRLLLSLSDPHCIASFFLFHFGFIAF